ncbi:heptaprenyl diphosphate synthase [Paenibacillus psychroresistens]|uniref:Heptaprenyl diphosphate synthase n=1 Tax=Paenibacillus psychroresistens TaxID=1778678 RepID=A0A6B8RNC1_9BACL|nr:heptaprenyl diphosphate synthase component 1 [Paenibacillus psychroresistens]QGQ96876.1 heptaprenyl diphosphate synthase [Paenibacillus psychroresistens]
MNAFRIAEITKPYTDYDMIQKHTSLPELAECRANLLLLFLNTAQEDTAQNELITIATSLVQLGLDTHDLVPVNNVQKEEKDARSRQLKVLAGDYFSSRFYHILAKAGQIEMIKQLSNAICEVNRTKMNLYLKMKQQKMTTVEFLEQSTQIKIQLFLSFEHLLNDEQRQIWSEILHMLAVGEVLWVEIERSKNLDDFQGSWAYWHLLQSATKDEKKQLQQGEPDKLRELNTKYRSTLELQLLLDKNIGQLKSRIQQIESESLKHKITAICEPHLEFQTATEVAN